MEFSFRRKAKVIIIEQEKKHRDDLKELLDRDYDVLGAGSSKELMNLPDRSKENASIIILGSYMPAYVRYDFINVIQYDEYLSTLPILVISDRNEEEENFESVCFHLGATDFIMKTSDPEDLLIKVKSIIKSNEALDMAYADRYDPLTGAFSLAYFCHKAETWFDEDDDGFDLVVLSVRDYTAFRTVCDETVIENVLKYIYTSIKAIAPASLISRRDNDFYIMGKKNDRLDTGVIEAHLKDLSMNGPGPNIRVQLGTYLDVDKSLPMNVLCRRAVFALEHCDEDEVFSIAYYNPEIENNIAREQRLLICFHPALEAKEFVIRIQPKVDAVSGNIIGGEALVRWLHEGQMIPPSDFIPLFERKKLIHILDEYVFRMVCEYQRKAKKAGHQVPISVNLSRESLFRENLVQTYKRIAELEQVELSLVPLEITESALVSDLDIKSICYDLVNAGFYLHMDDFGSGYSSFSSLTSLPFSVVKADKSLIDQIDTKKGDVILKSLVEASHALDLKIVAEGVEDRTTVVKLAKMGCMIIQGFYYAKPMEPENFYELLYKDDPFEKGKVYEIRDDDVINLNKVELDHYLKSYKRVFDVVRIVDPLNCSCSNSDNIARLTLQDAPCFATWARSGRCDNCISLDVYHTHQTRCKIESVRGKAYIIYSTYVEVDGEPKVIEMVNPLGEDVFNGDITKFVPFNKSNNNIKTS